MGLESPTATVSVSLEDGSSIELSIGAETSDGAGYYVSLEDEEGAFVADSSVAYFFTTMMELYQQDASPAATTVDSLVVERADAPTLSFVYSEDGAELSELDAENLLEALEDMQSEGEGSAENAIGASPEISFTFHRNTEDFSEMTLEFIQYDNNFYLVSFNGEQRLLVNRNDVADLSELIAT